MQADIVIDRTAYACDSVVTVTGCITLSLAPGLGRFDVDYVFVFHANAARYTTCSEIVAAIKMISSTPGRHTLSLLYIHGSNLERKLERIPCNEVNMKCIIDYVEAILATMVPYTIDEFDLAAIIEISRSLGSDRAMVVPILFVGDQTLTKSSKSVDGVFVYVFDVSRDLPTSPQPALAGPKWMPMEKPGDPKPNLLGGAQFDRPAVGRIHRIMELYTIAESGSYFKSSTSRSVDVIREVSTTRALYCAVTIECPDGVRLTSLATVGPIETVEEAKKYVVKISRIHLASTVNIVYTLSARATEPCLHEVSFKIHYTLADPGRGPGGHSTVVPSNIQKSVMITRVKCNPWDINLSPHHKHIIVQRQRYDVLNTLITACREVQLRSALPQFETGSTSAPSSPPSLRDSTPSPPPTGSIGRGAHLYLGDTRIRSNPLGGSTGALPPSSRFESFLHIEDHRSANLRKVIESLLVKLKMSSTMDTWLSRTIHDRLTALTKHADLIYHFDDLISFVLDLAKERYGAVVDHI